MKETTVRILCDICGKEVEEHNGLSQFTDEWCSVIIIERHSSDDEIRDTCIECNSAIRGLIYDRRND